MQQRVQMSNNIYQELKFHYLWEVSMIYSSFPSQVFPFYSFPFLITFFSLLLVELSISTKLEVPDGSNQVYFAYSYILSTMLNTKANTENIFMKWVDNECMNKWHFMTQKESNFPVENWAKHTNWWCSIN